MVRKVGDGWRRGLPFIIHPPPQRPVFTLFRATAPRCQATPPAWLAEAVRASRAASAATHAVLLLRGNPGSAGLSVPPSMRVGPIRSSTRPAMASDPQRPPLVRATPLATLVTRHPIITFTSQPSPPASFARNSARNDAYSRRSHRIFTTVASNRKKHSHEGSSVNCPGAEVIGACPRIQPPLHPSRHDTGIAPARRARGLARWAAPRSGAVLGAGGIGRPWQQQGDRGAIAGFARERRLAAALLGKAIDLPQPEPGAGADLLGGEIGIEGVR